MNSLQIPLQAIPSQNISIVLNGQKCVISLREMGDRQYFTLSSNGVNICQNVLLQNNSPIIKASYLGFVGDFAVEDLMGNDAPVYSGWNSRWFLFYNYD